jgi:hypothetical protein
MTKTESAKMLKSSIKQTRLPISFSGRWLAFSAAFFFLFSASGVNLTNKKKAVAYLLPETMVLSAG